MVGMALIVALRARPDRGGEGGRSRYAWRNWLLRLRVFASIIARCGQKLPKNQKMSAAPRAVCARCRPCVQFPLSLKRKTHSRVTWPQFDHTVCRKGRPD